MDGARRKTGASRPLADLVESCIAPALARFGFGEADIVSGWTDIAGPRIASFAEPLQIKWPRRPAGPGGANPPATLVVRVEGPFALELQHIAPLLIERINAHLGWRCIGKLTLRQAPLAARAPRPAPPQPPDPAAARRAASLTRDIDDPALRDALARLGARALKPG